jgi:hypothetical protein
MNMKIGGVLVDILCELNPTCEQFVVTDSSNNRIHARYQSNIWFLGIGNAIL